MIKKSWSLKKIICQKLFTRGFKCVAILVRKKCTGVLSSFQMLSIKTESYLEVESQEFKAKPKYLQWLRKMKMIEQEQNTNSQQKNKSAL